MDIVDLLRKEGYVVVEGVEETKKLIELAAMKGALDFGDAMVPRGET